MSYKKMIKSKEVLVDRETGEAEITVTLYGRRATEYPTKITAKELKEIAMEGGAEMLSVISGAVSLSNRYGERTGTWVVKIPSLDPENSTMSVLKKRKKQQTKKTEVTSGE